MFKQILKNRSNWILAVLILTIYQSLFVRNLFLDRRLIVEIIQMFIIVSFVSIITNSKIENRKGLVLILASIYILSMVVSTKQLYNRPDLKLSIIFIGLMTTFYTYYAYHVKEDRYKIKVTIGIVLFIGFVSANSLLPNYREFRDLNMQRMIRYELRGSDINEENLLDITTIYVDGGDSIYNIIGISKLTRLNDLTLYNISYNLDGLDELSSLDNLTRLSLRSVGANVINNIPVIDSVTDLSINLYRGDEFSAVILERVPNIESFYMRGYESEFKAEYLLSNTKIQRLDISDSYVILDRIEGLKDLRSIDLDSCTIQDLKPLLKLQSLKLLKLRGCDIENNADVIDELKARSLEVHLMNK